MLLIFFELLFVIAAFNITMIRVKLVLCVVVPFTRYLVRQVASCVCMQMWSWSCPYAYFISCNVDGLLQGTQPGAHEHHGAL